MTSFELMVSLPSAALIVAGLGACITLLLRSNSQDEKFYRSIQHIADASLQMAMELELASAIASSSPTSIEFCVPDRTGDSLPEQIRYEWRTDDSSQGSLYRQINQGTEVKVIPNIKSFELRYEYAQASFIPNRFQSESVLLKKVDSVPAVKYSEESISFDNQLCVVFLPDSIASPTTWDLGALEIMIRSQSPEASGSLRLQVTGVDGSGYPDLAVVYADIEIHNRDLSSKYQYVQFPLAPISRCSSKTWLAAILSTNKECPPIVVQCLTQPENLPEGLTMFQTANAGLTWSSSKKSPRFLATGYTSGSSDQVSPRRNLVAVDIFMNGLSGVAPTMMASAKLLSQPEVP